jgi:hypothetical protein
MGKTLIKTDKVIKTNPENILNFYKFVRHYMHWDPQGYIDELNKAFPDRLDNHERFEIPLDIVILPSYMISRIPSTLKNVIKPKRQSIILYENFSSFDVYKVVDDPNGEITDTTIGVGIDYRANKDDVARIRTMLLTVEYLHSDYDSKTLFISTVLGDEYANRDTLTKALDTLTQLHGKSYSDFSRWYPRLIEKLIMVEEHLTLFLNFLYALHSQDFDNKGIMSWLFKPYSDLIKGYGCNFEEALSVVEFASSLLP